MRQRSDSLGRQASLRGKPLGVAAGVGVFVVMLTWLLGLDVFTVRSTQQGTVVTAEVTGPLPCTSPGTGETVRFQYGGKTRDGTLSACGHDRGERVGVAVPADASASGLVPVRLAMTASAGGDRSRSIALGLVALSCVAGGIYVFLVRRGPRTRPVPV